MHAPLVGVGDVNDKTLSDLEFDAILESLRLETSTPLGAIRALSSCR